MIRQLHICLLSLAHLATMCLQQGEDPMEEDYINCFIHPSTYLNKVLIGTNSGELQLWNVNTQKLVHSFSSFKQPIVALVQSPVLDVVAVGLLDGSILLFHLKTDKILLRLIQSHSQVTCIHFRTDGKPHLATGSVEGDIYIWDLEQRRLLHCIKSAHDQKITSLHYIPNQPILCSAGADNSLKVIFFWKFITDHSVNAIWFFIIISNGFLKASMKAREYFDSEMAIISLPPLFSLLTLRVISFLVLVKTGHLEILVRLRILKVVNSPRDPLIDSRLIVTLNRKA